MKSKLRIGIKQWDRLYEFSLTTAVQNLVYRWFFCSYLCISCTQLTRLTHFSMVWSMYIGHTLSAWWKGCSPAPLSLLPYSSCHCDLFIGSSYIPRWVPQSIKVGKATFNQSILVPLTQRVNLDVSSDRLGSPSAASILGNNSLAKGCVAQVNPRVKFLWSLLTSSLAFMRSRNLWE